jgi:S-adenosylmethionine decarboxylase
MSNYGVTAQDMPDLAPSIYRQRLVVEGRCAAPVDAERIRDYLVELSEVCGMRRLIDPVTHRSDRYGWAGWVHWESSGAHVYAWEQPLLFFSVDIYTCKEFDPDAVVSFTEQFLRADEIVARLF